MKTYQYLNPQNTVVAIFDEDGISRGSGLSSALQVGTIVAPYVSPVPTVAELLKKIDSDVDSIYGSVLGNRSNEYAQANADAQFFKSAGYAGTVPGSVQSWATAKSWTATQAADDILTTAAQWVGAQSAIRAARLLRKEQVRNAPDAATINTTMAAWAGFVAYIRGQLGI